jgi:MFS family permease
MRTELVSRPAGHRTSLACAYAIEGLNSVSANLLMNGIAFYTTQNLGWSTAQNLLLMMAQGICYAAGALSADRLAGRFSKTRTLLLVNACLLLLIGGMQLRLGAYVLVPLLLGMVFVSTVNWPLVESLVTEGCDARRMNRRVTIYNLTWSGVGVLTIALYGTIMHYWPAGPLVIPLICQGLAVLAALVLVRKHTPPPPCPDAHAHADPAVAAQLARHRRTAMWLARISLPVTFVVANTLMGVFPKLAITAELDGRVTTLLASLWMASRFLTFIVLGLTRFWHTRPLLLLLGSTLMLLAFLGIVLPADRLLFFETSSLSTLMLLIVAAELVLGVVAGFVFSASLYFGMILSDGSAEHGGYHEALIGVGMVLGPGIAAAAQALVTRQAPGLAASQMPSIVAVSAVALLAIALASSVAAKDRRR